MTDDPISTDELPEPAHKGFWSLQSDEESVARGQNNFWAMLETTLAIVGFWYVTLTYETFFPLITSLFVAPLLFLRSEAAVKQGATWFQSGFFATAHSHEHGEWWANDARNVRPLMWLKNNVAIISSIFIALPAVWHSKADQSLAPALWGLVLCYGLMGTTVALALILEYSEKGAGAYGVVHAITGELTTKTYSFSRVLWMQSFALGLYFYALVVRVRATFCHFRDGYRDMPANVRRLAFRVSPLHAPDLLPGLPEGKRWRFDEFFDWVKSELTSPSRSDTFLGINGLLMLAIWFAPGWAYRVVLKSTLWFWWILFIVGGAPRIEDGIEGLRADAYRKALSWVFLALAIYGVAGFIFVAELKAMTENHRGDAPLLSSAALLFLVDWSKVPAFQWVAVTASALTLGVALWTNSLFVDRKDVPGRATKVAKALPRLGYLVKWKSGVGITSIALTMLYFALYANAQNGWLPVSPWTANWLHWLYGDTAQALLGGS